jgi:hypothetical protein
MCSASYVLNSHAMQDALTKDAPAVRHGFIQDNAEYISCYVTSLVQGFCTPRQPRQLLPGADALGEHDHSSALAVDCC